MVVVPSVFGHAHYSCRHQRCLCAFSYMHACTCCKAAAAPICRGGLQMGGVSGGQCGRSRPLSRSTPCARLQTSRPLPSPQTCCGLSGVMKRQAWCACRQRSAEADGGAAAGRRKVQLLAWHVHYSALHRMEYSAAYGPRQAAQPCAGQLNRLHASSSCAPMDAEGEGALPPCA